MSPCCAVLFRPLLLCLGQRRSSFSGLPTRKSKADKVEGPDRHNGASMRVRACVVATFDMMHRLCARVANTSARAWKQQVGLSPSLCLYFNVFQCVCVCGGNDVTLDAD